MTLPPDAVLTGSVCEMVDTDGSIRTFANELFDRGSKPPRPVIEALHDAMRWPVAARLLEQTHGAGGGVTEYRVFWLREGWVGSAKYSAAPPDTESSLTVMLYPLRGIEASELTAVIGAEGFNGRDRPVKRSLSIRFSGQAECLVIGAGVATTAEREQADALIAAILGACESPG